MRKKYKIRNFVLLPVTNNEVILQNDFGVVRITNQVMITLLLKFEEEKKLELTVEELEGFFDDEAMSVISFLEKYGVIEEKVDNNFRISNFLLFSNHDQVSESIQYFINEELNLEYSHIKDMDLLDKIPSNTLCFVFLNPYSKKHAKKIRDKFLYSNDSYLMISYIYQNHLYIDSPYNFNWKTPCHLCQIGIIEEELRDSLNNHNYQSFIDSLYEKEPEFHLETNTSRSQILNITTTIINRIDQLCGVNRFNYMNLSEINKGIVLNLDHNSKRMDTTIHWEFCDCYEI